MSEFAIAGIDATVPDPRIAHHGPYATETAAADALQQLRDNGTIHRLHSTIYELPDEETDDV